MAEDELELDDKGKKGGRKKLFLIIGVAVVLLLGGGGAALWFTGVIGGKSEGGVQEEKKRPPEALYLPIDPAFVVNIKGGGLMQVNVEVMARDPAVLDAVKKHLPAIRDALLMLFSSLDLDAVSTIEGKQRLRRQVLAEIRKVLEEETGDPGVEKVYFTSFVTQ